MKVHHIAPHNISLLSNLDKQNATVLVYHPGCFHCQMMRGAWEEMKESLHKKKKPCNIYEINAEYLDRDSHPITQNVEGFPTIMNIDHGKVKNQFEKERNIDNMMQYVLSNLPHGKKSNKKSNNGRNVRFSLNKNGSLVKSRKVLNANALKNSIQIHKKTLKKKQNNNKKGRKNKKNKTLGKK